MTIRSELEPWIVEAITRHGGKASVVAIAKEIWTNHRREIEARGNALYTWQYDMRWAGQSLQKQGKLSKSRSGWSLTTGVEE